MDDEFDWFVARQGVFEKMTPDAAGILKSETIPGLWLDVAALIKGDMPRVLAVLREGINSPEHAAFSGRG